MATSVYLSPSPILQFFTNNGLPNVGGSVLTQVGGINYATYQDSAGSIPLPNPIPLNSQGQISNASGLTCQLFLQTGVVYEFTIYDSGGNQINQATYVGQSSVTAANLNFTQVGAGTVTQTVQNKLQEFLSVKDWGAKCDGLTDDTTAIAAAIASIGSSAATLLVPGPSKISGALTFGAKTEVWFLDGGSLVGTTGSEVIQIQQQMVAGPHPILTNCAPIATNGMTVCPEWFGAAGNGATDDTAAIQLSITFLKNTGGVVQFDARTYNISSNINIGTALSGSAGQNTVLLGKGQHSTNIQQTSAAGGAFQILGASGSPLQGISIRDMSITKNVTPTGGYGIYAQYTALLKLRDVQISGYLYGVGLLRATNTLCEKVSIEFSGSAPNWHGFDLNGGGTGAGGNASSVFRDCYVDGTGATGSGSIGFYAYGAYVSDLQFLSCETTTVGVGYEFDMTASLNTGNEDVQLINCRSDACQSNGVYVIGAGSSGSADSMLTIIGGWFDMGGIVTQVNLIQLTNCQGIMINGAQLYNAPAEANVYGVYMTGCEGCTILGNTFRETKYGVYSSGGRNNMVKGNNIYNAAATPATQQVAMTSEAYSSIQGNTFRGYATNGAVIDNTCTACSVIDNIADPANITTRYSNASTGTAFTANNIGA